jgi:pimeloyl-ACP methyl ester carboxylesterase
LFLGGWCVNRTVFDDLAQRFARRRQRLTLDWCGHGESERPVADFGAAELVEDALAVIRTTGTECIFPVALAHSCWVAVELRRKLMDRVPKIVFLDWLITGAPKPFLQALADMQSENRWRSAVESSNSSGFIARATRAYQVREH